MRANQQKDLAAAIGVAAMEMNHIYGLVRPAPGEEDKYDLLEQEKQDRRFCDELADLVVDIIRERKMCELYKKWKMGDLAYTIQVEIGLDSVCSIITDRVRGRQ
jgi:hypothetical protein